MSGIITKKPGYAVPIRQSAVQKRRPAVRTAPQAVQTTRPIRTTHRAHKRSSTRRSGPKVGGLALKTPHLLGAPDRVRWTRTNQKNTLAPSPIHVHPTGGSTPVAVRPAKHLPVTPKTSQDQRNHNRDLTLIILKRFGWIRAVELGELLWPGNSSNREQADRLIRQLRDLGLVIERTLPPPYGRAIVLSVRGARRLKQMGHATAKSGKTLGKQLENYWEPPRLKHDLDCLVVMLYFHRLGFEIAGESAIRAHAPNKPKYPDGLAWKEDCVLWVELERAEKSGQRLNWLAQALQVIAETQGFFMETLRPNGIVVAYSEDVPDSRGYWRDHRESLERRISEFLKQPIPITYVILRHHGVTPIIDRVEEAIIDPDPVQRTCRELNHPSWPWHTDAEGTERVFYRGVDISIRFDPGLGVYIGCITGREGESRAETKTQVKRMIAYRIVEKF